MLQRLRLLSLQSALFIKKIDLQNPLQVAQGINSASGNVFNGPPAILPLQNNTPPNVPLIILKSSDEKLSCNVSRERIDYRFGIQKDPPADVQQIWDRYYDALRQITEYFCMKNPAPIWRLGFVAQFFTKLAISANKHILSKYIQPNIIEDTWDINVNFLNRFKMETREVNRWLKIRPIRNRQEQEDDTAMIVEIDINTLQEQQQDLTHYEIDAFYEDAYLHMINQDLQKIMLE
jgi:hypothetical protein